MLDGDKKKYAKINYIKSILLMTKKLERVRKKSKKKDFDKMVGTLLKTPPLKKEKKEGENDNQQNERDLIIDPCAGSFIVLEVCQELNREFLGCDLTFREMGNFLKQKETKNKQHANP